MEETDVREEGGMEEGPGLEFGFDHSSSKNVDQHPQEMIRTDASPFQTASNVGFTPTTTGASAGVHHLPPLHPSSGMINVNTNGPIGTFFYNTNGGCSRLDSPSNYDVGGGARMTTLQPFAANSSFKTQAAGVVMGGGMNHQPRYSVFTPAQWQELKRQALIYKHIVSWAPIPPDLLVDPCRGALPTIPPLYPNLGRNGVGGGGYFNLRFTNNTDPEPGRCRRTDGKKWRCSRDVAPDQKYCERHLHRGRPRSRKPVEQQRRKTNTVAAESETTVNDNTISTSTANTISTDALTNTTPSDAVLSHVNLASTNPIVCGQTTSGSHRFPFLSTESEKEPRYLDWMRGGLEEIHSNANINNNIGLSLTTTTTPALHQYEEQLKLNTPALHQYEEQLKLNIPALHQYEEQLKLNYSSGMNDPCNSLLNIEFSSPSDADAHTGDQNQDQARYPLRSFIDAWSNEKTSAGRNMPSTSPSNLTLSMANNTEESSMINIQMGLGITNLGCGRSNSLSWMNPISAPLGGPLAEALQSGTTTSSSRNSSEEGDGVMSNRRSNNGGRMNLMGWNCCGSPKDSPPRMVVSSPTGVLQRTFVSLSDSSSNSSLTFQWMDHTK